MAEKTSFWKNLKCNHILIILFFIFSVKFSFLPINTGRIVLLYCLTFIILSRQPEGLLFHYDRRAIKAFLLLMIYGLYTTVITLLSGGENLANFLNIILIVLQIAITAYIIASFFIKIDVNQFLFTLLIVFCIQGILIFLNFLFPPYRELMYKLMPLSGNITEDNFTSVFRTRGIMQSSGASVSSFLALGFLLGGYFLTSFNLSRIDRRIVFICLPFVLIGILFTGRTGFIMVPIALIAYYILLFINHKFKVKSLLFLIYLPIGCVFIYILFKEVFILISPAGADIIRIWENWAFDSFLSNFNNTSGKKSTLDQLQSFIFIPESDMHLLFGDPSSWGVIRTDLGYIRMIYSVGVLGSLLFYGGFIQLFMYILRTIGSSSLRVLCVFIFLWLFLIEYKEPMFLDSYYVSLIMLILFYAMTNMDKINNTYESIMSSQTLTKREG